MAHNRDSFRLPQSWQSDGGTSTNGAYVTLRRMDNRMTLNVNGEPKEVQADGETNLLEVLRNDLGLTGTKYGCGESQCGACTVFVDGHPVKSCITALSSIGEKPIQTIESLAKNGNLHPVQQAFIDAGAMQCGYCTPGMIMSAVHLLRTNPKPTERQIVQALQGNICRCCAYPQIVDAVKRAADAMSRST